MELRIKGVVEEKEMTVQTLADKMGIDRAGLSNYINRNPSVAILEKIAIALEVSTQESSEKESSKNISGYIEIGTEIFKIISSRDIKNIISHFNSIE